MPGKVRVEPITDIRAAIIRPFTESAVATESAPSEGPTERSSTIVSLAGNAPDRSLMARSLADSTVKLPEIWPEPPRISERITGADSTLSSSTIANGRCRLSCVKRPKTRAPFWLKRKLITASLVRLSKPCCASTRSSPCTIGISCSR